MDDPLGDFPLVYINGYKRANLDADRVIAGVIDQLPGGATERERLLLEGMARAFRTAGSA